MPIPPFEDNGWLPPGHYPVTWAEVVTLLGGETGSRRDFLTEQLRQLREGLRANSIRGVLLLDGSYVSAKHEPGDFDVLLIRPTNIQGRKDVEPSLADLLDAQKAEQERGYSLFYIPSDSPALGPNPHL